MGGFFGAMPNTNTSSTYASGTVYGATKACYATAVTASGKATFYITQDGTAGGTPIFSAVIPQSIQVTSYSTTRVLTINNPVVAGDMKSVTVDVYENASLLSLGLLPFQAAANGYSVTVRVAGV